MSANKIQDRLRQAIKERALYLCQQFYTDPFPPLPGNCIYGIFVKNAIGAGDFHLVYIGSTSDMLRRIRMPDHPYQICRERLKCHVVSFMSFMSDTHLDDEKILIKYFKPIFNKIHK